MFWKGVGACAAIALLGAVAGHVATGSGEPPATRTIHVGAATLTVPAGWRAVDGPRTTLSNGHDRMRVAFGSPADPSLVPPALRAPTRTKTPTPALLGGYRAWSYGGVTVLPSARGVLGVACATSACTRAIRSVAITGATVLTPTPDLALRLRAPALLATLDAARVSARAALADTSQAARPAAPDAGADSAAAAGPDADSAAPPDAGTDSAAAAGADANSAAAGPDADSAAPPDAGTDSAAAAGPDANSAAAPAREFAVPPLRRLAAAHRAALDGLRPVAGPALVGALSHAEQAYVRIANASAADYDAARAAVVAADREVDLAVARLARAGAPAAQRPPAPAATPHDGVPALVLWLALAAGLLLSALVPAGLRRLRASTLRTPCPVAGTPCLVIQRRRTPITPPPTYGRWNEAPRGPSAGAADGDARDGAMASSSTA